MPAFKSAIFLAIGILIGSTFYIPPVAPFISVLLISALVIFLFKDPAKKSFSYTVILLLILFGIFRADISFNILSVHSIARIPDTPEGDQWKITGIINDIPDYDSNKIRFNMDILSIVEEKSIEVEGEIIATIYKSRYNNDSKSPHLKAGDKIEINGRIVTPWGKRNPGEFDYREYLVNKHIYKTFIAYGYDKVNVISGNNLSFFENNLIFPAKYYAIRNINKNNSGDEGEYLKGLITGQRNDISAETKQAFINSGVMHLIAVSGLNVAYVIIIIATLLAVFRIYHWKRTAIVIAALIFYCIFTGNSPSIVRATVMGILLLIAYESERKTNFYNVAGFSALAILIIDPRQIFDPSFILSYTAVITMVLLYEKMKPLLLDHVNLKEYRYGIYAKAILILIVTTFAAQIGVLPVAGSYFEKVSVISIIANLIVVPVANLSLGIGFMQIITGIFSEYLSSLIAQTNQLLLNFQLWFIKQCASVDFAYFEIYRFDIVNIIFYFIIVTVIFTITKENLRQRIIVVVLIFVSVLLYNIEPENKFRMTFLDVGEGSSLVIENTDGKVVLINTGIKKQTYNSGERTIIPYLKRRGLEKIDLLIITDDNPENTGGLEYISGNFPIEKLIFANNEKSDIDVKEGDLIDSFEDLRIYFLSPVSTTSGNINLKISYRDLDILIVSQQNETERSYLTIKYDDFLDADILHSKNISLFNHIPQIYVTPSEENLPEDKKSQLNRIVNTNKKGAFIVESTGENIEIIDWR